MYRLDDMCMFCEQRYTDSWCVEEKLHGLLLYSG
jgi:hypothetical protein